MTAINKIFGPPGSGKTTYLLNLVEQELSSGTPANQIGYFAFTRKAATEAKDRAMLKFPTLNAQTDFPWFRTLHSLAFRALNVSVVKVASPHLRGRKLPIRAICLTLSRATAWFILLCLCYGKRREGSRRVHRYNLIVRSWLRVFLRCSK